MATYAQVSNVAELPRGHPSDITVTEVHRAMQSTTQIRSQITEIFRSFDSDSTGTVASVVFKALLQKNLGLSDWDVDLLIESAGFDSNAEVPYDAFIDWVFDASSQDTTVVEKQPGLFDSSASVGFARQISPPPSPPPFVRQTSRPPFVFHEAQEAQGPLVSGGCIARQTSPQPVLLNTFASRGFAHQASGPLVSGGGEYDSPQWDSEVSGATSPKTLIQLRTGIKDLFVQQGGVGRKYQVPKAAET